MTTRSAQATPKFPLAVESGVKIRAAALADERSLTYTAKKAEMSRDAFMRRMRGEREWSLTELATIADVLGVAPSTLLPDTFKPATRRGALRAA